MCLGHVLQCLVFAAYIRPQVSSGEVIALASLLEEVATMAAGMLLPGALPFWF